MASFSAYLEVGGSRYPLTYYDLYLHQQTDALGRPASLTKGGTLTCELHSPDQNDTVLTDWMLSPTRQHDGFVHLYREDTKTKLKTISFFNAYCVDMNVHFWANGSGPMLISIVISPQRVAVGAVVHDNNWPVESHGAGITYTSAVQPESTPLVSYPTLRPVASISPIVSQVSNQTGSSKISSVASTCPPDVRDALQREVNEHCKGDQSACKGNDNCSTLATKMEEQRACVEARWLIMVKCYKGGDASHKEQLQNRINGLIRCQELFAKKCGKDASPDPVPNPVPVPPVNTSDPDFMRRMQELTGLSGAALVIYLILSEGSRLFPPRNLIPLP